jgi:hypothetical protein
VWFQDEVWIGPKNKLTYRWAGKGSRLRTIRDQRTQSTYPFGAVCPERGTGVAFVLPACNTEAMQLHVDEIATKVTPGIHAVLILDQPPGRAPKTSRFQATSHSCRYPRAPQLNSQENIGSSCASTGCQTVSSNPSTTSLICCFAWK